MNKLKPISQWYTNDANELMTYIYWLKSQIVPTDPAKKAIEWNKIVQQLSKNYPVPMGTLVPTLK